MYGVQDYLAKNTRMKISLDWLSDYIDIQEKDLNKIQDIITERSAEIETVESMGADLDKVVVGKILELGKHPNADSLKLCKVDDGKEVHPVVCGGSNLEEGMLVAFAQLGAIVKWHGTDVVEMKKAKIRGEESFGMICASEEIGLADMFPKKGEKEIVDLSPLKLKVGQPLAEALGLSDSVLDVDNHAITNRSDLFSQRGFAREFVANGLGKWKKDLGAIAPVKGSGETPIEINIADKALCKRYMGIHLKNVTVGESPDWMKKRLIACGVNPISNIVDITNYIMLDLGMPLHAFDLDRVSSRSWTMRQSKKGEKVTTLDGQTHELMEGVIVLDDGKELIDLCGIMGGESSGINDDTKEVWLIAPVYSPRLVRFGMRGLGHISDAAIIYEKGVDPMLAEDGLNKAVNLIQELCPKAEISSEVLDIWPDESLKSFTRQIELKHENLKRFIGIDIEAKRVLQILNDLGFEAKEAKGIYKVNVPSFRLNDVEREADLIEEITRIYGFNNIPAAIPKISIEPVRISQLNQLKRTTKDQLIASGFDEIYTFAFLGPELLKKTGMEVANNMIEIANPISSDMSLMRTSLLPRMLETVANNLRYANDFKLFELSQIYQLDDEKKPVETDQLIISQVNGDMRELQGVIEDMGLTIMPPRKLNLQNHQHPGRMASIVMRGKEIGSIYELHPQTLKNFDIKDRVQIATLNIHALNESGAIQQKHYQAINKYPSVELDVSILINKQALAGDFINLIAKTDKKLISSVELIDEYTGDKIAENERALTFNISYQATDRTLTDKEVGTVHEQVLERLKKKGATIR